MTKFLNGGDTRIQIYGVDGRGQRHITDNWMDNSIDLNEELARYHKEHPTCIHLVVDIQIDNGVILRTFEYTEDQDERDKENDE